LEGGFARRPGGSGCRRARSGRQAGERSAGGAGVRGPHLPASPRCAALWSSCSAHLTGDDIQIWRLGACLLRTYVPRAPRRRVSTPDCRGGVERGGWGVGGRGGLLAGAARDLRHRAGAPWLGPALHSSAPPAGACWRGAPQDPHTRDPPTQAPAPLGCAGALTLNSTSLSGRLISSSTSYTQHRQGRA
jgi:hypothetical protein